VSTSPIFSSHQNPGQKQFFNFKKRRKTCGEEEKETERERDFSIKLCLLVILVTTDLAKGHSRKERERVRERHPWSHLWRALGARRITFLYNPSVA
jgi:hypothetical protein